ncbi:TPA: NAD-dependent epimerase/dehydratase family protein [Legionella pneumophila]|uniref:NAD dependent epimerase/dehydratase family protein n=1 Tax=Legionella pneumophila TaxID=446 RepID=A0A378K2G1_LEGPN|nr:NAD-dependent epimerase/dehydratase family protein [Legionella pneumophila]MDW9027831.1 NAD-dependent epimerase/dehydratase family protein [Legionella pneumophila]MDW9068734.1 NAD-dependent epimerase/dehydratase family protein [Legionella pneumophila]MDW9089321.1 NAD-dependent epimerase/dehydratase family protein [Legionella pneumophila]MDW9092268.1 NAD-dependent epimerase/dehydratase family protein [Legionella pneumophila]MDW9098311.1 NAD-dependent epimerase/dehydratase family protein [Leg
MAHILITGGCGFIGSHLAAFHLEQGDEVLVVDNMSSGSDGNLRIYQDNPLLHIEQNDILSWPDLTKATGWADRIYHMAAIVGIFKVLSEPVNVIRTNIGGAQRLLDAIVESGSRARVLLASSSSVYGAIKRADLSEEDDLIVKMKNYSLSTYMISKVTQEAIALAFYRTYQIPLTLVRLFNVIGPRQTGRYGMVVPRFVQQACNNKPMTVFGDGTQTRSFCDVRDAVKAMDRLLDTSKSIGEIINVGNTQEISISKLAELVKIRTKSSSNIQYISYEEAYGPGFRDTTQRKPNLSKLCSMISYKPSWTLENTIDDLASAYIGK